MDRHHTKRDRYYTILFLRYGYRVHIGLNSSEWLRAIPEKNTGGVGGGGGGTAGDIFFYGWLVWKVFKLYGSLMVNQI